MTIPAARATRPGRLKIDRLRVELSSFISRSSDECRISSAHQTHETGLAAQEDKKREAPGKAPPESQCSGLFDDDRCAVGRPAVEGGHCRLWNVDAAVATVGQVC